LLKNMSVAWTAREIERFKKIRTDSWQNGSHRRTA
jgi:hypothetical protein